MTRRCELSGKLPMSGNTRSHAENAKRRTFRPNLCRVSLISETLGGRQFRFRVSAHALKTVEHRGGLDAYLIKAHDAELSPKALKVKHDVVKARADTVATPA
jgi:large subunit ribosomal protein L28